MFQNFIRNSVVGLFGLVARSGLHRLPGIERIFLALYPVYKKFVEAGPVNRLREFVPNGSLVIDVGANVGFFSVRFAEWVGPSGEVIAIEPEDRNFGNLVSALKRRNLLDRVHTLKAVATATSGAVLLEINSLHPADHKISRDGIGVPVDGVTLDELVPRRGTLRPSLIKIDVQGAEMLVLQGASKILEDARPALFIELQQEGLARFESSVHAILSYLSKFGYEPYWLARTGPHRKASFADIHEGAVRNGYVDVLFLGTQRLAT